MKGISRLRSGRDEGIAVRLCARRVAPAESSGYDSGDREEQRGGNFASICTDWQPFTNHSAVLGRNEALRIRRVAYA